MKGEGCAHLKNGGKMQNFNHSPVLFDSDPRPNTIVPPVDSLTRNSSWQHLRQHGPMIATALMVDQNHTFNPTQRPNRCGYK